MVVDELSLIRFGVYNFFAVLMNKPVFQPSATTLCEIAKSIVEAETEPDEKLKGQIVTIYEETNPRVKQPLSVVELAVFKNIDRGLNRAIEIGEVEFPISELYRYLEQVRWDLVKIVIEIAKKYTLDIPISALGGSQIKLNMGGMG